MGGATHSALTLIKEMKKKGNDVFVVVPHKDEFFSNLLAKLYVKQFVIKLCFKAYPSYSQKKEYIKWPISLIKTFLYSLFSVIELVRIIKDERIDIVHTNVGPIVCGYEACKKTGIHHVWHIREYGDKDFNINMIPSKNAFRQWLKDSNVITITKDLLNYNLLERSKNACVIYNGVRKKSDVRFYYPKDKFFLCASRISKEKGFEQTIKVFAKFKEKECDYRLKVIGLDNDNYTKHLQNLAEKLEISESIDFEGYKDNVSDYMAHATALLVSSPFEGFGRMTAEAAFAGCLVVGKNTAGTKEIMDITGGYPFITDEEMVNAMVTVCNLTDDEYREKAMFAQRQAILYFSEESYVEQVYNYYISILSKSEAT